MTRPGFGLLLALGLALTPLPAQAQNGTELGVALVNATIGLADHPLTGVGAPLNGFGFQPPAIYASFFVSPHVAIEPQFTFAWVTYRGNSSYAGSIGLQADYFMRGIQASSPYLFALGGVGFAGDVDRYIGGGVGYRAALGRLAVRIDGKYLHFIEPISGAADAVAVGISIGGVFRRQPPAGAILRP